MKPLKQLKNWQLHTLADSDELVFKYKSHYSTKYGLDIKEDKIQVLTGTVLDDSTGKLKSGNHTRTSAIVRTTKQKDRFGQDRYVFETVNSIYLVYGKPGDDVIGGGDWGYDVMRIFY